MTRTSWLHSPHKDTEAAGPHCSVGLMTWQVQVIGVSPLFSVSLWGTCEIAMEGVWRQQSPAYILSVAVDIV